jgi:hypothetical protein
MRAHLQAPVGGSDGHALLAEKVAELGIGDLDRQIALLRRVEELDLRDVKTELRAGAGRSAENARIGIRSPEPRGKVLVPSRREPHRLQVVEAAVVLRHVFAVGSGEDPIIHHKAATADLSVDADGSATDRKGHLPGPGAFCRDLPADDLGASFACVLCLFGLGAVLGTRRVSSPAAIGSGSMARLVSLEAGRVWSLWGGEKTDRDVRHGAGGIGDNERDP